MKYVNDKGREVASNYYEGILQLRNPSGEVIKFVKDAIKDEERVFVAKRNRVRNGFDYKLSSKKFLMDIGKRLQRKFGGEVKTSSKLYGVSRETSKKIYRVTVLFRLPNFKVGDIVKIPGRFVKVTRLGSRVFGIDVDSGKKISFDYDKVI